MNRDAHFESKTFIKRHAEVITIKGQRLLFVGRKGVVMIGHPEGLWMADKALSGRGR